MNFKINLIITISFRYGKLREVSLKNGYGFVEFDDDRDADDACHDLDGKELLGGRQVTTRVDCVQQLSSHCTGLN